MSSLKDTDTIGQGREEIRQNWRNGLECCCCGQDVKLYERTWSRQMAKDLIALYHLGPGAHHYRSFITGSAPGDYAKPRWWGMMIPEEKNDDPKKKSSGYWRITEHGKDFVEERVQVPRVALVFDKKFFGYEGEDIGIREILHGKDGEPPPGFNYIELMGFLI